MLPGQQLQGVVSAFSPSGDLYALATPDGRIKTFDTGEWTALHFVLDLNSSPAIMHLLVFDWQALAACAPI
jgi:hypothetical protein